jgi:hypothetical protein
MRRILIISLMLFVAGCATTSRPVVDTPVPQRPSPPEPAAEPPRPAPPLETKQPEQPAELPPVTRKWLGLEDFAEANDEKLLNVYVGMSRPTVERLMDGHQSGKWINPYKRQTVAGADRKNHEVLFYLTRAPRPGQRVTENFLTPVIFQNERVIAIGRYPLKKLRRAACQSRNKGPCV